MSWARALAGANWVLLLIDSTGGSGPAFTHFLADVFDITSCISLPLTFFLNIIIRTILLGKQELCFNEVILHLLLRLQMIPILSEDRRTLRPCLNSGNCTEKHPPDLAESVFAPVRTLV